MTEETHFKTDKADERGRKKLYLVPFQNGDHVGIFCWMMNTKGREK
jgi:hypothetical protein